MSDEYDSKKKILKTAVLLFSSKGYRETSVRDISKEAGVNISMISYYFGGKAGLLENIVQNVTDGFVFFIKQFDIEKIEELLPTFEQFFIYLENHRLEVKILFSEMGKGHDYLLPIKIKIKELQSTIVDFIMIDKGPDLDLQLERKLRILTDVLLGMIFSDYIFDFSSFQEGIDSEEKKLWREERIQMLIRIFMQISGLNSGQLTFESIFEDRY